MTNEKWSPVLYIGLPVGALVAGYFIIDGWLNGPIRSQETLLKQQYDEYVKELKEYAKSGTINEPDYQTILQLKKKGIDSTQQTIASLAGGVTATMITIAGVALVIVLIKYIVSPIIRNKYTSWVQNQKLTSQGMAYVATCAMAEDLAAQGYVSEASTLVTVMQSQFNSVDLPFMQTQIAFFQSQLPFLMGSDLFYANYMISAYISEISLISSLFSLLPPLL